MFASSQITTLTLFRIASDFKNEHKMKINGFSYKKCILVTMHREQQSNAYVCVLQHERINE